MEVENVVPSSNVCYACGRVFSTYFSHPTEPKKIRGSPESRGLNPLVVGYVKKRMFYLNHNFRCQLGCFHDYLTKPNISMVKVKEVKKSSVPVDDKGKYDGALDPKVGLEFQNEEEVYDFYNKHARKVGFSIRKNWRTIDRKTGIVKARRYVCSKEGHRVADKRDKNVKHHRDETRTGCEAFMMVRLQVNGKYRITETKLLHNHFLATPQQIHLLRSQRKFADAKNAAADDCDSSGNLQEEVEFVSRECEGQENNEDTHAQSTNYLRSKRMKVMDKFDAGGLLEYFKNKQLEDPSFFYSIQIDADERITNIFWSDGRMLIDYERFSDVVCFDTSYKTEEYGRPFAPFIGVNHHRQVVIFGAAFLYDETIDSFRWLFKTFCDAMSGKQPKNILTDRNKVMENAIKMVLPESIHRISLWHMFQDALKQLSHVFTASRTFANDFSKCVYDCEEEDEFLHAWDDMIEKYNLVDNTWLQQLFNDKEKWAVVYGKDMFCADMKSILQSESLNKELKKCMHPTQSIFQFFEDFQKMVDERCYEELKANFKMMQSPPKVIVPVDILIHASRVYTPKMFEIFQTEYVSGLNCIVKGCIEVGIAKNYEVVDGKGKCYTVTLDSMDEATLTCSCKKYELIGILCGHVLRVIGNTLRFVPTKYILKRWRREASSLLLKPSSNECISEHDHKKAFSQRYNHLFLNFVKVATRAAESEETYRCATDLLDKMSQDKEVILKNSTHEEPSKYVESLGDEVGRSMRGFFEKPPVPSTIPFNTCPPPIYYPVPTTPPTMFLQESSLFGTSQQYVIGSSSREISKELH